jgi:hypothetical protein
VLDVIRALELPIALVFNRGRVMAMLQGSASRQRCSGC